MTATPARIILDVVVLGMLLFAGVAVILVRRRVRFSLATVMLWVLLVALLCGALTWHIRTVTHLEHLYQAQEQAVRKQLELEFQQMANALQAELDHAAQLQQRTELKLEQLRAEHQDALTKLKTLEGAASRDDRRAGSNP